MSDVGDKISEFDLVALTSALPAHALPAGQTGTVVHVHGQGDGFEVEFILEPRRSVVATVRREHLLKLHGLPVAAAG
jgi:hypothetical protein